MAGAGQWCAAAERHGAAALQAVLDNQAQQTARCRRVVHVFHRHPRGGRYEILFALPSPPAGEIIGTPPWQPGALLGIGYERLGAAGMSVFRGFGIFGERPDWWR